MANMGKIGLVARAVGYPGAALAVGAALYQNSHILSSAALFEIVRIVGYPGLMFVVWYIFWRGESRKWELLLAQEKAKTEAAQTKEDKDRAEHLTKWQSMVDSHGRELERAYKVIDRQSPALEATMHQTGILADRIDKLSDRVDRLPESITPLVNNAALHAAERMATIAADRQRLTADKMKGI